MKIVYRIIKIEMHVTIIGSEKRILTMQENIFVKVELTKSMDVLIIINIITNA